MAYDGRILALARDDVAERRRRNDAEHQRRRAEVYEKLPALRAVETEITRLMTGVATGTATITYHAATGDVDHLRGGLQQAGARRFMLSQILLLEDAHTNGVTVLAIDEKFVN